MTASVHSLVLRDRGVEHIHRWAPTCTCGWVGRFRRRKVKAVAQHHSHVNGLTRFAQTQATRPRRQRPTPADRLPAELR